MIQASDSTNTKTLTKRGFAPANQSEARIQSSALEARQVFAILIE